MAATVFPDGGKPQGHEILNPHGSLAPLIAPNTIDPELTHLLYQKVYEKFFRTRPKSDYASLEVLLFDKAPKFFPRDEFSWYEMPDQRVPIVVDNGVAAPGTQLTAAQGAVPNDVQTATIPLTSQQVARVGLNTTLHFKAGGWATVTAKGATSITVTSPSGLGLPAIIQGDVITIGAEVLGDNGTTIVNTRRAKGLMRTNFIGTFTGARSYGRKEWLSLKNGGQTDFLEVEEAELIDMLKFEAVTELWNGVKNQRILSDGRVAKGTDGIKTQMINAGVSPIPSTITDLVPLFESLSHSTNFSSGVTYVVAQEKLLAELSKAYKSLQTRYTPETMAANINLNKIEIGSRTHVLVPANLFAKNGHFPGWEGHMFMLDKEAVHMAGMLEMPFMDINGTIGKRLLSLTDNLGSRLDNFTHRTEMTFAPMVVNPQQCALIDVQLS